ncbi:hypothetical protein J4E86_002924 [Alternaria arbusti]|uniref:uncharacterized protein n=1 Tax=Alternaria arbusti TaxID=232088 RepID=UPI002220D81F|nr:uncharacterized protein J4E86_002924 [Alternaria arbusti]KAI4959202.1 hypothetical protein J4E86_002924 [Alternaria arbusti]
MNTAWSNAQKPLAPQRDTLKGDHTVILGAGVIGLATAYQLALAHQEAANATTRPHGKIIVVERAAHISPASSGQATGGLGDFGFASGFADLGVLSYKLFQELAPANGTKEFGFSESMIYRIIPDNFTGSPQSPDSWGPSPPVEQPVSGLPDWIRSKGHWSVQRVAVPPHTSHLDPIQFCQFLYQECKKLGVEFIFNANATSVQAAPGAKHFTSIQIKQRDNDSLKIPCRSLVIAAGPWSPRVYSTLFPHASFRLPMNSTASAGNHFRVRTPKWKPEDDEKGSEQVFFQSDVPGRQGLDITSSPGGELYVGGWGAAPEELPELAEDVHAQLGEIERMMEIVKGYLRVPEDDELEVFAVGRCYRPLATFGHPIVTRVDWELLGMDDNHKEVGNLDDSRYNSGGLFLNTAHFDDGVTLSLGSGKVMSELLLDALSPTIYHRQIEIADSPRRAVDRAETQEGAMSANTRTDSLLKVLKKLAEADRGPIVEHLPPDEVRNAFLLLLREHDEVSVPLPQALAHTSLAIHQTVPAHEPNAMPKKRGTSAATPDETKRAKVEAAVQQGVENIEAHVIVKKETEIIDIASDSEEPEPEAEDEAEAIESLDTKHVRQPVDLPMYLHIPTESGQNIVKDLGELPVSVEAELKRRWKVMWSSQQFRRHRYATCSGCDQDKMYSQGGGYREAADNRCMKVQEPCAYISEHDGQYIILIVPLPKVRRQGKDWKELGYWVL